MRTARYYNREMERWDLVHANAYDPENHGTDLRCADGACDAGMHFRVGHPADGKSYESPATFVSNSRADHIRDCSALQYERVEEHGIALREALAQGAAIVASMNFSAAHPNAGAFSGNRLRTQKLNTPLNRWRYSHRHATQSVPSASEFEKFRDGLEKKSPGALSRLWVSHAQEIVPHCEFHLADKGDFIALSRRMKEQAVGFQDAGAVNVVTHSFPRYFTFKPTEREKAGRSNGSSAEINGNRIGLYHDRGRSLVMLNRLVLSNPDWRDDILAAGSVRLISTPKFNLTEFQQAARRFNAGQRDTEYFALLWPIISLDQVVMEPATEGLRDSQPRGSVPGRDFKGAGHGRTNPGWRGGAPGSVGSNTHAVPGRGDWQGQHRLFPHEPPSPLGHLH